MKHVLLTNDFPPKVGGIQSYLWELWRRLPPEDVTVYTTAFPGALSWDHEQPFRVVRSDRPHLRPTKALARAVDALADETGARLIVIDPAFPIGIVGRWLQHPYGVVLHGAEVTIPGRLPVTRSLLAHALRDARVVVAAGGYPLAEGSRAVRHPLDATIVPPGVDVDRFVPLDDAARLAARRRFGLDADATVVLGLSRLVPRKGFDVLIEASARLRATHPSLVVVIGGAGRDRRRLEKLAARHDAPVRFAGRVEEDDLPALYGCADLYVMLCRNRWLGLEQEGFGIVFLEAAACCVPQIAGRSGGSHEAVVDGETGVVVDDPTSVDEACDAIGRLLGDGALRQRLGTRARERAVAEFTYDRLASQLAAALDACEC